MRLVLTNDDGIDAPGLLALLKTLEADHEVLVVAPEVEQSAVGHAITLADPIKVRRVMKNGRVSGWAVKGTPADCVKLACWRFWAEEPPDLVVSGINRGANVGLNVLYSGTVSAATEAGLLGRPAVAFSLDSLDPQADYGPAAALAARLVALWVKRGLTPRRVLNVNFPNRPDLDLSLCRLAHQGLTPLKEKFLERQDPRGNLYFWQGFEVLADPPDSLSDQAVLAQGLIPITPLQFDLTDHACLRDLQGCFEIV